MLLFTTLSAKELNMHKPIDFKPEQMILFIGDSITDCDRLEFPYTPLGRGYVHFAANFLLASCPQMNLNIQNRGIAGDTTEDLLARWETDCIQLNPDIVSLMIGINDLWRKFADTYEMQQMYVSPDDYESNMRLLLSRTHDERGSQLILMEPFMFCDDVDNPMLQGLPVYLEIVHNLAREYQAVLVPVHTNYTQLNNKRPADQWAEDTVHPYEWAHAWIAKQWLNAVLSA